MKFLKYIVVFSLGFLIAKLIFDKKQPSFKKEEIQLITNGVKNLSKLVVSTGNFSEIYSFSDSKKYFYNYIQFDKKAIVYVDAKVEVGYDLSKLDIQIDSIGKQIIINKIPTEEITINPNIKYFDIQESQFNNFSTDELNKLNQKSVENIEKAIAIKNLKAEAKSRLFEELSKIYQLSKVFNWKVIDNTQDNILQKINL